MHYLMTTKYLPHLTAILLAGGKGTRLKWSPQGKIESLRQLQVFCDEQKVETLYLTKEQLADYYSLITTQAISKDTFLGIPIKTI